MRRSPAGLAAWARARPRLARPLRVAVAVAYAALTFWTAFNIPIARQLSSPLTYAFVHATGSAITDSISVYLTPFNIGLPLALWSAALVLPRVVAGRRLSRRALVVGTAVAAAGGVEVYDLVADPGERHPLGGDAAAADVAKGYRACLGL